MAREISQMTNQEIAAFLEVRKQEEAKLVRENGVKFKTELEAYCLKKYNMSLASIFLAGKNAIEPKTYKNPATGGMYTYKGKGKVPAWLKIPGGKKPNPQYLVANGAAA